MGALNMGALFRQLRNGPIIAALLLFGLTLLGLHVYQADLPQRLTRQSHTPAILEAMEQHQKQMDSLVDRSNTVVRGANLQQFVYEEDAGVRDPMVGPWHQQRWAEQALLAQSQGRQQSGAPFNPPTLVVQGVIVGKDTSYAIVNRETVRVGDMVEGAQVVQIDQTGITVKFEGVQLQYKAGEVGDQGGHLRAMPQSGGASAMSWTHW